MAITPQAIKDQEFQSKFRGYDTIEVKAYLELVAEEFFELLERLRQQEDEVAEAGRQKELDEEINHKLEDDLEAAQRTIGELRSQLAGKEEKQAELAKDLDEMQTALDDFEQERKEYEEEISESEGRVSEIAEKLQASKNELDALRNKISLLEEQNQELKQEEVDFKRTIGVAQRFADDLRKRAQEETDLLIEQSEARAHGLLQSSEEKANRALQAARDEIERLRREAYAELSRLPEEIERLNQQRKQARQELREILTKYLADLESFAEVEEEVRHYDYDELFQKIDIPEGEETLPDELDNISMDLPLPEESEFSEEDDDLKNKLEEGGVAYLSDN